MTEIADVDVVERLEEAIIDARIAGQFTAVTHSVVISQDDAMRILATLRGR